MKPHANCNTQNPADLLDGWSLFHQQQFITFNQGCVNPTLSELVCLYINNQKMKNGKCGQFLSHQHTFHLTVVPSKPLQSAWEVPYSTLA